MEKFTIKKEIFERSFLSKIKNPTSKEVVFRMKNKEDKSKCMLLCGDYFLNPQDVGEKGIVKKSEIMLFISQTA